MAMGVGAAIANRHHLTKVRAGVAIANRPVRAKAGAAIVNRHKVTVLRHKALRRPATAVAEAVRQVVLPVVAVVAVPVVHGRRFPTKDE